MAQIIEYELQRFGVTLTTNAKVLALVGGEKGVSGVKAASGLGIRPADMVRLDTGVAPNVELARDAGIQIGVTGAISVNAHMETNMPGIYAAGNCAETFCAIRRRPVLRNAVAERGAGRVVVAADSDLFGDDCIGDLDHEELWANLVTWAATPALERPPPRRQRAPIGLAEARRSRSSYARRATGASLPRPTATRSEAASSSSRPRRPADTWIVGK